MELKFLDRLQQLVSLSQRECQLIASLGQERTVPEGSVIMEEGSTATSFFILLSGRAELRLSDFPVDVRNPGEFFGVMSLFNNNVRVVDAVAIEPCTILEIETAAFLPLVLLDVPAAVKLMQSMGQFMVRQLHEFDADPTVPPAVSRIFAALKRRLMADWALKYHEIGRPGKLSVVSTKPTYNAADLSVAYSPGVAEPCMAIKEDRERAYDYTAKGQLVAVITNGTAVLGLGDIGPTAAKPVMEGKAVLFKRFADLDAFDIEIDEYDPDKFIEIVCSLEPTFGGVNLEDVRSPECFYIEKECERRMDIPVFHDDQHGTAIIAGAGLVNALDLAEKKIEDIRAVFSGAGAAGFACAKYFLALGVSPGNLIMTDINGVVYKGRGDENYLDEIAVETEHRTLAEAIEGADVFMGVSAGGLLTPEMLKSMNRDPIVFAMANPVPEIDYRVALDSRSDVIVGTGRSDYPNQVNNVIAFPYIFRGALDVRARNVNEAMKLAATKAIASLAREPITPDAGFDGEGLSFGRGYVIPKPFDRRLLFTVAPAVAKAAMETGAERQTIDLDRYVEQLASLAQFEEG